jgi:hypothetical protein
MIVSSETVYSSLKDFAFRPNGGHKPTEDPSAYSQFPVARGSAKFDSFTPIENWVEKGIAPDKPIVFRMSNARRQCIRT